MAHPEYGASDAWYAWTLNQLKASTSDALGSQFVSQH